MSTRRRRWRHSWRPHLDVSYTIAFSLVSVMLILAGEFAPCSPLRMFVWMSRSLVDLPWKAAPGGVHTVSMRRKLPRGQRRMVRMGEIRRVWENGWGGWRNLEDRHVRGGGRISGRKMSAWCAHLRILLLGMTSWRLAVMKQSANTINTVFMETPGIGGGKV